MCIHGVVVVLALALFACVDEHYAVVSTAAIAEQPWRCPDTSTKVHEVAYATWRLEGCGEEAVYECNFALTVARCWRP